MNTTGQILKNRIIRKAQFLHRCTNQGLIAKAKLIVKGKGANGRSMSPELLAHHGLSKNLPA